MMQLGYTPRVEKSAVTVALETFAEEQAQAPRIRAELVARARESGMTWVDIAHILGMTPHGLIKAAKKAGTFP